MTSGFRRHWASLSASCRSELEWWVTTPRRGPSARADLPELEDAEDPYASLEGTHLSVVCTDWDELRGVDPAKMAGLMAAPAVVDGRNLLDADAMVTAGFTYLPTGRPPVRP
jgi:UDPglucose 6-dehydrogenase